jgi:hypothetical protein
MFDAAQIPLTMEFLVATGAVMPGEVLRELILELTEPDNLCKLGTL